VDDATKNDHDYVLQEKRKVIMDKIDLVRRKMEKLKENAYTIQK